MPEAGQAASLARRLGAMLYDAIGVLAIWLLTLTVFVVSTDSAALGPAVTILLALEMVGFFVFFWRYSGQTLGMRAWRIILVSGTGQPPTLAQLIVRLFGAVASIACAGLGYAWILLDQENRSWADLLSNTRIVNAVSG